MPNSDDLVQADLRECLSQPDIAEQFEDAEMPAPVTDTADVYEQQRIADDIHYMGEQLVTINLSVDMIARMHEYLVNVNYHHRDTKAFMDYLDRIKNEYQNFEGHKRLADQAENLKEQIVKIAAYRNKPRPGEGVVEPEKALGMALDISIRQSMFVARHALFQEELPRLYDWDFHNERIVSISEMVIQSYVDCVKHHFAYMPADDLNELIFFMTDTVPLQDEYQELLVLPQHLRGYVAALHG